MLHVGNRMLAAQNCTKANWVTLNEELGVRLSLCGKCPQGGAGTVRGTGGNVLHPTEAGWLLMGMWQVCEAGGVGSRDSGSKACVPSLCPDLLLNLSARVARASELRPGPLALWLSGVCWAQTQTQILRSSWPCPGWAALSGTLSTQCQPLEVGANTIFSNTQHQARPPLGLKDHLALQPWASPSLLSGPQPSALHSGHLGGLWDPFGL